MAEATDQTITWTPFPSADAVAMFAEIYRSQIIAEAKILGGLAARRVRWDCLELIGKKRDSDPGRGDPAFWHGLPKSAVHLPEGWARRRALSPHDPRRHFVVVCDYKAVGIVFAREDLIELLPPAEQARLAEAARGAVQEVEPPVSTAVADSANELTTTEPRTAKRPKREPAAEWLKKAYPQYVPGEFPDEISVGKVQRRITALSGLQFEETTLRRVMGRRQ